MRIADPRLVEHCAGPISAAEYSEKGEAILLEAAFATYAGTGAAPGAAAAQGASPEEAGLYRAADHPAPSLRGATLQLPLLLTPVVGYGCQIWEPKTTAYPTTYLLESWRNVHHPPYLHCPSLNHLRHASLDLGARGETSRFTGCCCTCRCSPDTGRTLATDLVGPSTVTCSGPDIPSGAGPASIAVTKREADGAAGKLIIKGVLACWSVVKVADIVSSSALALSMLPAGASLSGISTPNAAKANLKSLCRTLDITLWRSK